MAHAMLLSSGTISCLADSKFPSKNRGSSLLLSRSQTLIERPSSSSFPPFSPRTLLFPSPSFLKTLAISKFSTISRPEKLRTHTNSSCITSQLHQSLVSSFKVRIPTSQQNTSQNAFNPEQDTNSTDLSKTPKIVSLPTLLLKLTPPTILLLSLLLFSHPLPAHADPGAALFGRSCIGCHDAGGNVIQPGATLFAGDLERNGVNSEEEIYRITYQGKGRMPGFGLQCAPRGQCTFGPRLSDDEIRVLARFVKSQSEQGWENSGSLD